MQIVVEDDILLIDRGLICGRRSRRQLARQRCKWLHSKKQQWPLQRIERVRQRQSCDKSSRSWRASRHAVRNTPASLRCCGISCNSHHRYRDQKCIGRAGLGIEGEFPYTLFFAAKLIAAMIFGDMKCIVFGCVKLSYCTSLHPRTLACFQTCVGGICHPRPSIRRFFKSHNPLNDRLPRSDRIGE